MKRLIRKHTNIYGMARIGFIQTKKGDESNLEVYVNTDDGGNIPHFHIRDANDWDEFHSCVRLDKAEYFLHEGKAAVLNSKQRKLLQKFMTSTVKDAKYGKGFKNNWELTCFLWNINNSKIIINNDVEQPDYTELD